MPPGTNMRTFILLGSVLACGGCSADTSKLKTLTDSVSPGPLPTTVSSDPPVEVYARIARGALKCWFGPEGSLKASHVFHAKVDSPTSATPAEIAVHTREAGSSHGVLRAFAISITPSGSGSLVEAQNIRFPAPQGEMMIADVGRWTGGSDTCSVVGAGGWNAGAPPAAASPPAKPVLTKSGKQ
jgi:hypothetical protein